MGFGLLFPQINSNFCGNLVGNLTLLDEKHTGNVAYIVFSLYLAIVRISIIAKSE